MNNKLTGLFFVLSLVSGAVNALGLGSLQLNSYLNQPLKASITLDNIELDSILDIEISQASHSVYRSYGLFKHSTLKNLKLKIVEGKGEKHIVQLSTKNIIKDPILEVLLQVTGKKGVFIRQYTLMLDFPDVVNNVTLQKLPLKTKAIVEAKAFRETPLETKAITKQLKTQDFVVPVNTKDKLVESNKLELATTLVANKSLSILSQSLSQFKNYSIYQVMRGFYLGNTKVFINGNINQLVIGSTLKIPSEDVVAELSRQKSINFVYSVSKNITDNEHVVEKNQDQATFILKLDDTTQLTLTKDTTQVEKVTLVETGDFKKDSKVNFDKVLLMENENNRLILSEIKQQSIFSEKQYESLASYSDALSNMKSQLDDSKKEIKQLIVRVDALEVLVFDNQKLESLPKANEPLSIVTTDVGLLSPVTQPKESNVSKIFFYALITILIVMMLIFVIREVIWHNRVQGLKINNKNLNDQDKPSPNIDEDETIIIDDDETIIIDEDETIINEVMPEHELVEQELSESPILKNDVVNLNEIKTDENEPHSFTISSTNIFYPEDIMVELDVFIAYQQYDEALELIKSSKESLGGNEYLDIKELELLSYKENVGLFFITYEGYKNTHPYLLPNEWEKIEAIHDNLFPEFQLKSVL